MNWRSHYEFVRDVVSNVINEMIDIFGIRQNLFVRIAEPTEFDIQISRIEKKIKHLRQLDRGRKIFGSERHKYIQNRVLSANEISEFENRFGIVLPKDFVMYLRRIGNGGVGPFYGIVKLEDSLFSDMDYRKANVSVDPSLPFPHTEAKVMFPNGIPEIEIGSESEYEEEVSGWFDPIHTQGILRICNFGCGVFIDLVVNGDEYANIWSSDLGSDNGIYPGGQLEGEPERITFLNWYELWLDQSLKQF